MATATTMASADASKKRALPEESPSQDESILVKFPYYGEHKRAVSAVSLAPSRVTPSSPVCASASADGTVKLWNLLQKEPLESAQLPALTTMVGHSRGVNDLAWSPQGGYVATASDDKTLRLWDAQTSDALVEFRGHSNFVFCVRFNPQSNLLVSGSFDETVKLWDVRTGDCVSTLPAHSDPVTGVDINRDGTCIVSGSHDGLIRVWDTATGECLKTFFAQGNPPVSSVKYSPNGQYVLAGTLDEKLRLWKVGTNSSCLKAYSSHSNTKYCVATGFLVDSETKRQSIVTGSETGKIYVYDLNSQKAGQVLDGHKDAVLAVACHDKQEYLCSGGMTQDRTVQFWAPSHMIPEVETLGVAAASSSSPTATKRMRRNTSEGSRLPLEPPRI